MHSSHVQLCDPVNVAHQLLCLWKSLVRVLQGLPCPSPILGLASSNPRLISVIPHLSLRLQTKQEVKVKELVTQSYPTFRDPMDGSLPALLSMVFSRQEYWSGEAK